MNWLWQNIHMAWIIKSRGRDVECFAVTRYGLRVKRYVKIMLIMVIMVIRVPSEASSEFHQKPHQSSIRSLIRVPTEVPSGLKIFMLTKIALYKFVIH